MNDAVSQLQRFLFSHHLYSGVRRAAGILLPITILGGIFGWYGAGLIATFGALCVAFIDQPGPHEHRVREMLGGTLLSTLTVAITGLASSHPLLIWFVVIGQCFAYSMLSVFGKKGGQIGFACLLLMTVTMHEAMPTNEVWLHTLTSFAGGLFYTLFSYSLSRVMHVREKEQALSVALFATADYVGRRADMYDCGRDLEDSYRKLVACQSSMTDKHQAARDMVLRGLAKAGLITDSKRIMLWNLFIEMIDILETLVATRTDYALLREKLGDSDALLFMRDALRKMSIDLDYIALSVSREAAASHRSSVKAELRALEYEIEQMTRNGFAQRDPNAYNLCIEILRRLRHSADIIERMIEATQRKPNAKPLESVILDQSLSQFLSREHYRLRMITSNLRLDSPICRYALRVALAAGVAMTVWTLVPQLAKQGYWILLTVLIIMKPGFALTRQRNGWRLVGTLLGCAIALGIMFANLNNSWLLLIMVLSTIIGGSMLQINYMVASVFIGSAISFGCSYFLPWWEAQFMPSLTRAAISANREYLRAGLKYVAAFQQAGKNPLNEQVKHADLAWRLSRKNAYVALSNLADAFYRMMLEPNSRQWHAVEFNNLMIQNHTLASQIATVVHTLATAPEAPSAMTDHLLALVPFLEAHRSGYLPPLPTIVSDGSQPALSYPMTQLHNTVAAIDQEMSVIHQHLKPAAL
jgi:uncharacterized membrane protein YccC